MVKEKRCSMCKQVKNINEFYNQRSTKDGKAYCCKDCAKKRQYSYDFEYARLHERAEMLIAFRTLKRDVKKKLRRGE